MLSLPGGWYFSPASICLPLDGWNGLLSSSVPPVGANEVDYAT